jgi:hypothetical protein
VDEQGEPKTWITMEQFIQRFETSSSVFDEARRKWLERFIESTPKGDKHA